MKPSNVMIELDGNVKVVDFGIAKVFQPNKTGTQIGTPGYAPPEQYQGIATVQSDIYALGATLHHLLTGRDPTLHPPFSFEPARDINIKVSRRTSDVVDKALSFNSEDRFATVVEFRAAIRSLQGGDDEPLPDSPASTLTLPQMAQQPAPKQVSGSAQSLPSKKPKPPRKSTSSSSSSSSKSSRSSRSSRSSSSSSAPYIPPNAIPIQESELKRFWGCIWKVLLAILIILIFLCSLLMFIPTESIVVDEQTPISAPPTAVVLPTRTPAPSPTPRPAATPTPPPAPAQNLPTGFKTFEVEAELDANASDSEIKAALKEAYLQRVEQEYQGAVQANPNMISFVGEWSTTGGGTAGTVTYHSKVQGFLSPSSP
jgi:serine/threonine-protein kinase